MQTKTTKTAAKQVNKLKSTRVHLETQRKAERLLAVANKKRIGRKVKVDQLLNIALDLVTEGHLKSLQEQSLTNEDRKEILRQKYIEIHGQISHDEFLGFLMSDGFATWRETTLHGFPAAILQQEYGSL
jgi:Rps23 Pro-64 3,4-dihydroxylase Tpa1-like proline 4-hydroxylase